MTPDWPKLALLVGPLVIKRSAILNCVCVIAVLKDHSFRI